MLVQLEIHEPLIASDFRKLGSLAERYGMRVVVEAPASSQAGSLIGIDVPRAASEAEARTVVANLIDFIGEGTRVRARPEWVRASERASARYSDLRPTGREAVLVTGSDDTAGPAATRPAWAHRARRA